MFVYTVKVRGYTSKHCVKPISLRASTAAPLGANIAGGEVPRQVTSTSLSLKSRHSVKGRMMCKILNQ